MINQSQILYQFNEDESVEMRGIKEAMISKNIDINNYVDRWDSNFNSDKRLFIKNNMSLSKLIDMCNKIDISIIIGRNTEAELTNQGGE